MSIIFLISIALHASKCPQIPIGPRLSSAWRTCSNISWDEGLLLTKPCTSHVSEKSISPLLWCLLWLHVQFEVWGLWICGRVPLTSKFWLSQRCLPSGSRPHCDSLRRWLQAFLFVPGLKKSDEDKTLCVFLCVFCDWNIFHFFDIYNAFPIKLGKLLTIVS